MKAGLVHGHGSHLMSARQHLNICNPFTRTSDAHRPVLACRYMVSRVHQLADACTRTAKALEERRHAPASVFKALAWVFSICGAASVRPSARVYLAPLPMKVCDIAHCTGARGLAPLLQAHLHGLQSPAGRSSQLFCW